VDAEFEVFRALADPTRRAIFEQLALAETSVKDLTARFSVSQPAVSQHLKALRAAGLVVERREGRFAHYRAKPEGLAPLVEWIAHYRAFWPERLQKLRGLLQEMDE
jgi:DNA-binding transcriptional ArsR family regulator